MQHLVQESSHRVKGSPTPENIWDIDPMPDDFVSCTAIHPSNERIAMLKSILPGISDTGLGTKTKCPLYFDMTRPVAFITISGSPVRPERGRN